MITSPNFTEIRSVGLFVQSEKMPMSAQAIETPGHGEYKR